MSEELTEELILAAEAGELGQVKEALKKGADPNSMGPNSGAIHCAAFNNHKSVVQVLLKAGASPNIKDRQDFYPLHLAASKGYSAICTLLLKHEACDIEATTSIGGTALHVAVASGHNKTASLLIKAGANINAIDVNGNNLVHAAVSQTHHTLLKALLKAGADATLKDSNGSTTMMKAIKGMLRTAVNQWSSEGTNNGRIVKYEIVKGCFRYNSNYDRSEPNELGRIMSLKDQKYCASQSWGPDAHLKYLEAFDIVKTLCKTEVDMNATIAVGQSAMWLACRLGDAKVIEELYKKEANFDAVEDNGEFKGATCLHKLAASGRLDGLEAFFKLNDAYDINVSDHYGWTPLHYLADQGGHVSIAHFLVEKGADKTIGSTKERASDLPVGTTASKVAFKWNDSVIGNLLKPVNG